jgi:hypothetical protein
MDLIPLHVGRHWHVVERVRRNSALIRIEVFGMGHIATAFKNSKWLTRRL